MAQQDLSLSRKWSLWAATIVALILIAAGLLAFVIVPIAQGIPSGVGAVPAILRSIGIQAGSPAARQPKNEATAHPVSMVAWTPEVIDRLHRPNVQNGAKIAAEICAACHGENGISPNPQFPHLAGQSSFAIYKQLNDFKSGARVNELMAATVQNLDDDQMVDVSAHFSALVKGALDPRIASAGDPDINHLVEYGVSSRGIPACASCHGAHAGGPIETPTLSGQRQEYLAAQLSAFATAERRNDIFNRMRAIAGKLRKDEIDKLAEYYAAQRLFRPRD